MYGAGQSPPGGVTAASGASAIKAALKTWGLPTSGKTKAELWQRLQDQASRHSPAFFACLPHLPASPACQINWLCCLPRCPPANNLFILPLPSSFLPFPPAPLATPLLPQVTDSVVGPQRRPLTRCLVSAATRRELGAWRHQRISQSKCKVGAPLRAPQRGLLLRLCRSTCCLWLSRSQPSQPPCTSCAPEYPACCASLYAISP